MSFRHKFPAQTPNYTILLVDDDPAVCMSLQRVLATEGWDVVTAKAGEEALEYLRDHRPDLMITDLCMAQVSGWDLLFHETLQRPGLPVIVITALSRQSARDAAAFAAEFFQKPLDLDKLIAAIHWHLAKSSRRLPMTGKAALLPASGSGQQVTARR